METSTKMVSDDELDLFTNELPYEWRYLVLQVLIDSRLNDLSLKEIQDRVVEETQNDIQESLSNSDPESATPALSQIFALHYNKLVAIDLCRKLGYCDPSEDKREPIRSDHSIDEPIESKLFSEIPVAAAEYASELWRSWRE